MCVGVLVGICIVVPLVLADGDGSSSVTPGLANESSAPDPPAPEAKRDKLPTALALVADAARKAGDEAAISIAQTHGLTVVGGSVRVVVESASADLTGARAAIVSAGGTVEGEYLDTIQALLPPCGLDPVSASADVRAIRAPAMGIPGRAR